MNLSITPISYKNNYQNNTNCQRNNKQQNFEALPVKVPNVANSSFERNITSLTRRRDTIIDIFMGMFEDLVKGKVNTDALKAKGYYVECSPRFPKSSKMHAVLKDANDKPVKLKKQTVQFDLCNGNEKEQAKRFANQVTQIKF